MFYRRETAKQPTLTEVVQGLRNWQETHEPYDRTSQLNLFQFVIEEGTGGALVPLGNGLAEGSRLPTVYLSQNALSQYLTRLQYPSQLYNRLPNRLTVLNLNCLVQSGNYGRDALLRIQDGNQARALLTDAYQPLDNLELLEMMEPYLGGGHVRWHYDDELTFHLSVSFPEYTEEIQRGDVIERGLHITNSEVGQRSVTIAGYLYRLVCTNGLISNGGGDSFRFRHVGSADKLRDKVEAAVESTKLEVERVVAQFRNALTVKVDEPFEFMERVAKEHDLTQDQFKASLEALMNSHEPKDNLYGISCAISNAANLFEGEPSYELQRAAVDITGRTHA